MAQESQHLIFSVSTKNHESGIVRGTLSRHPDTPKYPITRVKPVHTTASSLIGRPVLNAVIKPQRKRPRHEQDLGSDDIESDEEFVHIPPTSSKRQRKVDSSLTSNDAEVDFGHSSGEAIRAQGRSTPRLSWQKDSSDVVAVENDVPNLEKRKLNMNRAAGDLLMTPKAAHQGGFTEVMVEWATCMAEALLLGAKHRFFDLAQQYEFSAKRSANYQRVKGVEGFELGDDPVLRRVASAGCWLFRDDTSEEAEMGAIEDLLQVTQELKECIAKARTLEMMFQARYRG
ncbi:uncharacterized protein PV09_03893 [Verruconis gallopava]|uniref:Uncharacterized protein n=1 Tax=Verruconis gallopava TaxID=253628 RepID=A0A0D1YXE6_9PEZI|nr:uncharacterized protein PV09_03893 [Verruconis gallopava]KIW05377.1 hypothetical protein PV09_03893 [Verruconis gallopava]